MDPGPVRGEGEHLPVLVEGGVVAPQALVGLAGGLVHPDRRGRHLGEPHRHQVGVVREEAPGVVQDLRVVLVEARQLQRHLHRLVVLAEPRVGPLQLEAGRAPERRVGRLPEALLETRQGFLVLAQLREAHREEDVHVRQARLQLQRLAQGRNGPGKVVLLEVDHPELGVHLRRLGAELPQLLVGPGRIRPAALREGLLALLGVPLERPRLGRLSEEPADPARHSPRRTTSGFMREFRRPRRSRR